MSARTPVAMCPIRPGDPCTLCEPGAELRTELTRRRRETQAARSVA